ncbi:MAG: family 20 glycosylhydrolase [Planctomycetota bacterium]|nr:family 20 glycosylhydrolase [Planctomycetota bacterium]
MKKHCVLPPLFGAVLFTVSSAFAGENHKPAEGGAMLPIRGLHCFAPHKPEAAACEKFIREVLPKEGVNHLVLEFNYNFAFKSHPALGSANGLDAQAVKQLLKACRESGVKLIPQFNCLGHQSWAATTSALLKQHPEFDETPHVPADNKGIYCREWCPLHPEIHAVVFALMDELADACEADAVHCGMDEVFLIGDPKCPRCGGKDKAELFAGEVKKLHDHLASKKRVMWMWGDRFLDGKATKIGKWEASENGTHPAIDLVPKDIVICDWHYDKAPETPRYFLAKGFSVVACPWKNESVALGQLKIMRALAAEQGGNKALLGMLQTTWVPFARFEKAYVGEGESSDGPGAAKCFKALFAEMRKP